MTAMSMNKAVSSLDAKAASIAPETEGCWMGSENRNISVKSPFEVGLIVIAFRGLNCQTPNTQLLNNLWVEAFWLD